MRTREWELCETRTKRGQLALRQSFKSDKVLKVKRARSSARIERWSPDTKTAFLAHFVPFFLTT
jgi:hypothetical protein